MAALGTCVFVGASTEQIPNKNIFIKTVLVKSSHIESMFFNSAQDSMSFTMFCSEKRYFSAFLVV